MLFRSILFCFWRHRKSDRILGAGIALTAILLVSHQYFGGANSSPTFFLFAVSIASLPILTSERLMASELRTLGVVFGSGTSILVLCRPFTALVQGLILISILFVWQQYRSRSFLLSAAAAFSAFSASWFILGVSEVNTPLFPLLKGNLAGNFPFDGYLSAVPIWTHLLGSIGNQIGRAHV